LVFTWEVSLVHMIDREGRPRVVWMKES
jgi:hypothetical protein